MQYTKSGNSDLNVSRICLGCMGFGDAQSGQHSWTLNEEDSREIIKRVLDLGVNFFDTAIVYQSGTSEQYLGRALKGFAKREDVVIATKFPTRTQAEIEAGVFDREHVRRILDKSLENLGMDYVDLYICHMWDYQTPLEEIMEGLSDAVKAGKARYIGISKRLEADSYAKIKYDTTAEQDAVIIDRVVELAKKHGVSMTEILLAWLLTKVTSPVMGATKLSHIEGAVKAVELVLTDAEIAYLEEAYVPHKLVGVMAQNTVAIAGKPKVWSTGNQKI